MELNKEAHDRFMVGDGITDNELLELLEFYESLDKHLSQLGEEFKLARNEVGYRKRTLERFKWFRELYTCN